MGFFALPFRCLGLIAIFPFQQHLIVYPISLGKLINVVAFCSWPDKEGTKWEGKTVEECTQAELFAQYEGWEPEVQHLLQVRCSVSSVLHANLIQLKY